MEEYRDICFGGKGGRRGKGLRFFHTKILVIFLCLFCFLYRYPNIFLNFVFFFFFFSFSPFFFFFPSFLSFTPPPFFFPPPPLFFSSFSPKCNTPGEG